MTCAFCEIANGRSEAAIAYEDAQLCIFSDQTPIRPGHVQIIPKAHFATFDVLPDGLAVEIMRLGQRVAQAQKRLFGVARVGFVFSGNDVAHAHAHLIPLHAATDLTSLRYFAVGANLPQADLQISQVELVETASVLREALA